MPKEPKSENPNETPEDEAIPSDLVDREGNRITDFSAKQKDMDKMFTKANRVERQVVKVGDAIAIAVRLVKTGEDFKYEVANGQVIATEKIDVFKVDGIAFVPEEEVREVVAVMALRILEDEEQRKTGQQAFNFNEPDEYNEDFDGDDS